MTHKYYFIVIKLINIKAENDYDMIRYNRKTAYRSQLTTNYGYVNVYIYRYILYTYVCILYIRPSVCMWIFAIICICWAFTIYSSVLRALLFLSTRKFNNMRETLSFLFFVSFFPFLFFFHLIWVGILLIPIRF